MKFEEIIVELSYNCNLSCSMCGFGKHVNPFHKSKFLTFEIYKKVLKEVGGISKTIRLNGRGESTIHPDFKEILDYTRRSFPDLNINLFSNMSFGNDKILSSMTSSNIQLFISMDSPYKDKLTKIRKGVKYEHVINNINSLQSLAKRPFIIFTIQEENLFEIYDIAKFAFENNCHILFNTIRRDKGIEEFVYLVNKHKREILEQFRRVTELYIECDLQFHIPNQLAGINLNSRHSKQTHGSMSSCPILDKEVCILYDGTVTPCNMFNPYVYGNIFEQDLIEIWKGKKRKDFLTSHKYHYYCNNCANLGM
ncbi:radical SAM protein [Aureispira sp. CCB-QB1]|uniref:radical SAM protein n=1 Tax=Aureispira sp. CCB-QB1 TaxID=1313421 RepID=UPI000696A596|nr:radical SAM protein [Aureispira sp. CCB-QB1]